LTAEHRDRLPVTLQPSALSAFHHPSVRVDFSP
jgi:hypothetical protein